MYLLDTNIVSELRRHRPHPSVLEWIRGIPAGLMHISAVTIGEIQAGIEITRQQDPAKAAEINAWLDSRVLRDFEILPMDAAAFRAWAVLMRNTSDTLAMDGMIAAIAKVRRLTVVTRNTRDFRGFGVPVLDPFFDHDPIPE